jgi:hypothetical protein
MGCQKKHGRVSQNCWRYNHYGSIFVHFRSPGKIDIHVLYLKMFVHVSALYIYTVRLSIRPLIGVNNVKPMSGGKLK